MSLLNRPHLTGTITFICFFSFLTYLCHNQGHCFFLSLPLLATCLGISQCILLKCRSYGLVFLSNLYLPSPPVRRHRAQYVIPYEGSSSPDRDLHAGGSSVTKQEVDLVLGLLLGFCISWVLLWLDRTLHRVLRAWRTHPQKGEVRDKRYKVH